MPLAGHTARNPTVEEGDDASDWGQTGRAPKTDQFQHSWPEICAQHDTILSSHLEMLQQVKNQTRPDGQAYKLVSNMLEKTSRLVTQFNVLKRQIVPGSQSMSTSSDQSQPPKAGLKRAIMSDAESEEEAAAGKSGTRPVAEPYTRFHKRKRLDKPIPGADEDVRNATSVETEDISEEVQRRLKIKEEQRKKRGTSKADKRKRDSMTSNGSASSPGSMTIQPRKKAKIGTKRDR
ncbi:hypothetical protein BO94DRAFT_623111 [Aspergillus sclerotioniger CBS 115572]|uniref:Uncharacterized protein n=1 Tax=Aspergillus sclerotioniger CBS 115572 TaxID=1450535 RepID=A0A317WVB7_9EURO|nr:hypothetical protein BO94DRAFT_623111 [Aspergillus sclerotioniger CBS 115572]PWY90306.1 hypothetical protein BO94DRAFT_623111 [Aspergillus sclerotioniger CBS 115572]